MLTHTFTSHQLFLARALGIGLGLLLGIAMAIHFGPKGHRMAADSTYGHIAVYGAVQLPEDPSVFLHTAQASFATDTETMHTAATQETRRGTLEQYRSRHALVRQTPRRKR